MTIIYSLILTVLYAFEAFRGTDDMFSPRFLYNAYAWLKNVPYFMQIGAEYSPEMQEKYFFIKLIGFLTVNLGITIYENHFSRNNRYLYSERKNVSMETYFVLSVILFLVGFAMKIYMIRSIGGLSYIFENMQIRGKMLSGFGYLNTFSTYILTCAVLLSEYYLYKANNMKAKIAFAFIVALSIISLFVFGARKPALMLILKIIICHHYCKKRIKLRDIIKPKYLILIILVILFTIMMPMLRYYENASIIANPLEWVRTASENADSIFSEFSYLEGDMYTFENFNVDNYWWGRPYLNMLVQWIPRSLYPDKPPMDDGMYLFNMMEGITVTPDMPTTVLPFQTSIPFTMEGALYINFGYIGLFVGGILMGILYQYIHKVLKDTNFNVLMIIIYQTVIFELVPSSLHIMSPFIAIVFSSIILIPAFGIRIHIMNMRSQNVIRKKNSVQ